MGEATYTSKSCLPQPETRTLRARTGGVTVILWKHVEGGLFDLYEIVPGFVASFAAIVVASRIEMRSRGVDGTPGEDAEAPVTGE